MNTKSAHGSAIFIRKETPKDYREVENLTREAFWNVYRPGCTEHYVLNQYRTNPDFIPELDLVMEMDDKIIGHVMFSKASLNAEGEAGTIPSWTFGPISIHPDYKRKGYGLICFSMHWKRPARWASASSAWRATSTSTVTPASASPAN